LPRHSGCWQKRWKNNPSRKHRPGGIPVFSGKDPTADTRIQPIEDFVNQLIPGFQAASEVGTARILEGSTRIKKGGILDGNWMREKAKWEEYPL